MNSKANDIDITLVNLLMKLDSIRNRSNVILLRALFQCATSGERVLYASVRCFYRHIHDARVI